MHPFFGRIESVISELVSKAVSQIDPSRIKFNKEDSFIQANWPLIKLQLVNGPS